MLDDPGDADGDFPAPPASVDAPTDVIGEDPPVDPVVGVSARSAGEAVEPEVPDIESKEPKKGWAPGRANAEAKAGKDVAVGPVKVKVKGNENKGVSARANVVDEELAQQLSPFAAAVSLDFADARGVKVRPDGTVRLTFDVSDVNLGPSADIDLRLRLTRYDGCDVYLAEDVEIDGEIEPGAELPPEVVCDDSVELEAEFDVKGRNLVVDIVEAEIEDEHAARRQALRESGVPAKDLNPRAGRTLASNEIRAGLVTDERLLAGGGSRSLAVSSNETSTYALTSGAASEMGDYSAPPSARLTEATVGLYTGAAETSYPIPAPAAAAGPQPSVALVYSSAGVDSMVVGGNNQPSEFGVGWSLSAGGSISRGLKPCNNAAAAPGDRCISSAPDDVYSMTLAGRSSRLVKVGSGATYTEFRMEADPMWRIRLNEGGSVNGSTVSTPDYKNEWWSVETGDGTLYTFGTTAESVDWLPVYYSVADCAATYALCDTARQWNLDTVTDAWGNQMTYQWDQEFNWYNARTIQKRKYVRSSNLLSIEYGANPGQGKGANARVQFDYEWRCGNQAQYGDCSWPDDFLDTPTDLWCTGQYNGLSETVCSQKAPTFWTQLRFTGVLSQVKDGTGWATVGHHDPNTFFTRDTGESETDSPYQNALFNIAERPHDLSYIDPNNASYRWFGFNPLNVENSDEDSGVNTAGAGHDVGTDNAGTAVNNGNWAKFDDVWLGEPGDGATEANIRMSGWKTGKVHVRLGHHDPNNAAFETTLGTINITSPWPKKYEFRDMGITFAEVSGVHDVYLVAESTGATGNANFTYLNFIRFSNNDFGVLPELAFANFWGGGFEYLQNRLNPAASKMILPRIRSIVNELGGRTTFTYGQDTPCTWNGEVPPTGTWATNVWDCFPQYDATPAGTGNDGYVIFNKWTVQAVETDGDFSANEEYAPNTVTNYTYQTPRWGFSDNPDSDDDTWNSFRGYNIVTTQVVGDTGKNETRFYQGINGERLTKAGAIQSRNVTRSTGATLPDSYALRGQVYETRRLQTSNNALLSRTFTDHVNFATKSGYTDRDDPRFTAPDEINTWLTPGATTKTKMTYGTTWGELKSTNEQGDPNDSTDNRTTATSYYNPTTSSALGAWRSPLPCVTAVRAGNSTTAPSAWSASGFDRWSRQHYNGVHTGSCSQPVVKPAVTRTWVAKASNVRLITNFRIDARGRVDRVTDPRGKNATTTFDADHGQPMVATNHVGWASTQSYDQWRRPTVSTNINNLSTTVKYDKYSRLTTVIAPGDSTATPTTRITYGHAARPAYVQTESRLDGNTYTKSAQFFDGFGRAILSRTRAPEVGENWATATMFDAQGRTSRASAQYGISNDNVTLFEYPDWGTMPSFTEQTYDALSRPFDSFTKKGVGGTISTVFDTNIRHSGFQTSFYDPNSNRTDTTVDGLGRTLEVKENTAGNLITAYKYNSAGDLLEVTAPDGARTTLTYDLAGRKTAMDDPDTGEWEYTYDDGGLLLTQTDPAGDVTGFDYDDLARKTRREVNGTTRAEWFYDEGGVDKNLGKLFYSRSWDNGQIAVTQRPAYDSLGRRYLQYTRMKSPDGTSDWAFRSFFYYRDDHQLSSLRKPGNTAYAAGETVYKTYDARTGIPVGASSSVHGTIVESTSFNNAGQMRVRKYGPAGADGVVDLRYNANTLRLTANRGGPTTGTGQWQKLEYQYDNNGNILQIKDFRNSNQRQCFSYDALDRLTNAYTDSGNCNGHSAGGAGEYNDTYDYNDAGNITFKTGNGNYSYDNLDHVHAVTATSDGSVFDYDDNGNMTIRNLAGEPNQTLSWDVDQRLDQLAINGGDTTTFVYDADGQRVRRQTGGPNGTTTYYPVGGSEYEVVGNSPGTFTHYYTVGGETVAYNHDGTVTWMWKDYVNSTTLTRTDNGANSVQRYTPWGETRTNGNLTTDKHYTGQIVDQRTGLAYYNARYYDPATGRFISPDRTIPSPGSGQSYNRYTYVDNNPAILDDPTGNCPRYLRERYGGAVCFEYDEALRGSYAWGAWLPEAGNINLSPAISIGEVAYVAASFAPVTGEAIDVKECGSGFGLNWGTGFDCTAVAAPVLSSKLDDILGAVYDAVRRGRRSDSVWRLGWSARGFEIERMVGASRGLEQLPDGFKTIDFFANGTATSVKSLDLAAKTYQSAGPLRSKLNGYVDTLANFQGARKEGVVVSEQAIRTRELVLVLETGVGTATQREVIVDLVAYGKKNDVIVTIARTG